MIRKKSLVLECISKPYRFLTIARRFLHRSFDIDEVTPIQLVGSGFPTKFFPDDGQNSSTPMAEQSKRDRMAVTYDMAKRVLHGLKTRFQQPERVFVNNELSLGDIEVYGFDYDYTLVHYEPALQELIYRLAIQELLTRFHYPAAIRDLPFDRSFAIRGLHFDIRRGFLFKLDAFHNVMLGTVYRGTQPVPRHEVMTAYSGLHISSDMMEPYGSVKDVRQFIDLFAIPEVCLLASIHEYFKRNKLEIEPSHLYWDVHECVRAIHLSGVLHAAVTQDLERFIGDRSKQYVSELLHRLQSNGKKLFLITNSPFMFVNKGLSYLIGPDWRECFDVIICRARKPSFFVEQDGRPFRLFLPTSNTTSWRRVTRLEKGSVYVGGNIKAFRELTGWSGSSVIFFGDHVFSDLADATQRHGWRTGAVVPELEREIMISNTPEFQKSVGWTVVLQELIRQVSLRPETLGPEEHELLEQWRDERRRLRRFSKTIFNPRFGSVFQAFSHPSYFSRRLGRYADIYTSHLSNLLKYPLDYTFYPKRQPLQHEISVDPLEVIEFDFKLLY